MKRLKSTAVIGKSVKCFGKLCSSYALFLSDTEVKQIKKYVPQALSDAAHLIIAGNELS